MGLNFFKCAACGNIITFMDASGVTPVCCGEEMQKLNANHEDASAEKHVPMITKTASIIRSSEGCCGGSFAATEAVTAVNVKIGELRHPSEPEHYIEWVAIETCCGWHVKWLKPGEEPEAEFLLASGETLQKVYAYCNIHGLWAADGACSDGSCAV